jgi:hypothetical protein
MKKIPHLETVRKLAVAHRSILKRFELGYLVPVKEIV